MQQEEQQPEPRAESTEPAHEHDDDASSQEDEFSKIITRSTIGDLMPELEMNVENMHESFTPAGQTADQIMQNFTLFLLNKKLGLYMERVKSGVLNLGHLVSYDSKLAFDIMLNRKQLRFPIYNNDHPLIDQVRSDAIVANFEEKFLILDQSPYKTDEYKGISRVFFILKPKQHLLQLVVFGPTQKSCMDQRSARINREVDLRVFNVDKINPNPLGD